MDGARGKPATISRYALIEELGRGGMGSVWRAADGTGREVALKLLAPGWGEEELLRFQREAALASELTHEGIVQVLDWGIDGGTPFIAMELVAGESLEARLRRKGPLPGPEAARLALDLARALAHAHTRGVLHRDVKPANVLIDPLGRTRLVDFGVARRLAPEAGPVLTRTGEAVGTPATMAPEQAHGARDLDGRVDVYGIGVTLFAALTGQLPFQGPSWFEVMERVLGAPPPAPSSLAPGVDPALEAICLRCLEKDPAARFAGARELTIALSEWLRRTRAPRTGAIAATVLGAGAILAGLILVRTARTAAPLPAVEAAVTAPPSSVDRLRDEIAELERTWSGPDWERVLRVGTLRLRRVIALRQEARKDEAERELVSLLALVDAQLEQSEGEERQVLPLVGLRVAAAREGEGALEPWLEQLGPTIAAGLGIDLRTKQRDLPAAITLLEWAIPRLPEDDPDRERAQYNLAGAYYSSRMVDRALQAYERVQGNLWVFARYRRCELLLDEEQHQSALAELDQVSPELRDQLTEGWAQAARLYSAMGRDDEAWQAVARLESFPPDAKGVAPWRGRARMYRVMGLVAAKRWAEARELRPELPQEQPGDDEWRGKLQAIDAQLELAPH